LSVRDDGEGFAPRVREGTGIGNLRRRLKTLFGDNARIDIASGDDGTTVMLQIPARTTHELV
jgi:LytS/YehU family sensor histidine kinase